MRKADPPGQRLTSLHIAADLASVICLVAGDAMGSLLPRTWSVLGLSPVFLLGPVLMIVRHLVWPTPSILAVAREYVARSMRQPVLPRVLLVACLTRALVLVVGLAATLSAPAPPASPAISTHALANLPARWDAFWYVNIVRNGYQWTGNGTADQQNVAFFPGYPMLMHVGWSLVTMPARILRDPELFGGGSARLMWGGALMSVLCFSAALPRLFRLARADTGDDRASFRSCVLLAAYPFALFYSVPYSESLALLALISLVLAWRGGHVGSGLLWGLVLGLTRSNGWTITLALLADRVLGGASVWTRRWTWALVAGAPLGGAALYSAYVYQLTGDPLAWAQAQHAWGGVVRPSWFFARRMQAIGEEGLGTYVSDDPVDAVAFACAGGMMVAALWLALERRWLYAAIIVAYLAPAVVIDLPAFGRMTALLFPAFILAATRLPTLPYTVLVVAFAAGQAWFAWRFFLWQTPY